MRRLPSVLICVAVQWVITGAFWVAGMHNERSLIVAFVLTTGFGAAYGWLIAPYVPFPAQAGQGEEG